MIVEVTATNTFYYDTEDFDTTDPIFGGDTPTKEHWIELFKDMSRDSMSDYRPEFTVKVIEQ